MTDAPAALPTTTDQIVLAARPHGVPTLDDFRLESAPIPPLGEDEVLVRNTVMSVDPYMRGRMNDVKSYIPPFQIGEPLDGGAVGEVIAGDGATQATVKLDGPKGSLQAEVRFDPSVQRLTELVLRQVT